MINTPKARKIYKELEIHGDKRIDNYYWLRDRDNIEVINYLNEENNYTYEGLKNTETLQFTIYNEIIGRIKQKDSSVPFLLKEYYYQTKYEEAKEYPIYLRAKANMSDKMEVLLDVNHLAEGKNYYQVGGLEVSSDNKILAYAEDEVSRRIFTIRFKNMDNGDLFPYKIENTSGNFFWADDNITLIFVEKDVETLRPYWVKKWSILHPEKLPETVFKEEDDTYYVSIYKSMSSKFLFIQSESTLTSEINYIDLSSKELICLLFEPRRRGHEYSVDHISNEFFIKTNIDGRNFSIKTCKVENTSSLNWEEKIAHNENILIEDFCLIRENLILTERSNALTNIRIINDVKDYTIPFDEEVYVVSIGTNVDPISPFVRIVYTSLTTPTSIYDFEFESLELSLKKQEQIVGGYEPKDYECKRIWAKSRDGERIPISLVYKKDLYQTAESPLLLYGYGSYGHSIDPTFGLARLSLLNRGFAFAIAHIRGGEEMGRKWYENGRLLKKMNSFYDFIDCGEYLTKHNYCHFDKLYAMGGSAGGLLMGAILNLKPEMWAGIVAAVPFVDVLTTMLDETIPLTTGEYDEWGNPNDSIYYNYIKKYSPYDNIEAKDYPPMLVTTGLHDSQVQYWEPAKWVAKLREMKTDNNPLFLHTNMDAGHGGASGRFKRYKEIALEYAFLLNLAYSKYQ